MAESADSGGGLFSLRAVSEKRVNTFEVLTFEVLT
jgi:hypothetical protein